jgi:uncharacterized repeat protein (TIGR03803 family)
MHAALFLVALTLTLATGARAADRFKVLHTFTGSVNGDGGFPSAGLIRGADGTLYGTTEQGGIFNVNCAFASCGVVFEMTTSDGKWKESVLHKFHLQKEGAQPTASPVLDSKGNLYGTTNVGGPGNCIRGCGVVFELKHTSSGKWSEILLHSFTGGEDGANPVGGVIFDTKGNLYGTTQIGGAFGYGVVFELSPSDSGQWKERVLHAFTGGIDGAYPDASMVFDASGNLYGTASSGGNGKCQGGGCGVVFKLSINSKSTWKETVLHSFAGGDGAIPGTTLAIDPNGNLFGTTWEGGTYNLGVAFRLARRARGSWPEEIIHSFTDGKDGGVPQAVILDSSGSLYGLATGGGIANCPYGCGVVFKLTPTATGKWEETVLHSFTGGDDGANPEGDPLFDVTGNLYGTTTSGGVDGWGVVFELTH